MSRPAFFSRLDGWRRTACATLALWVALAEVPAALAQRRDSVEVAREHYSRGMALYNLMKYEESVTEFERAYTAKPDPVLLYNLGQANRLSGQPEKAIGFYRNYLRNLPDAANQDEVRKHIDKLQKQIDVQKAMQTAPPQSVAPSPQLEGQRATSGALASAPPAATPAASTPAPNLAAPPAKHTGNPAVLLTRTTPDAPEPSPPIHGRWWFWTGMAVAAGAGVAAVMLTRGSPSDSPNGTLGDLDLRRRP